MEFVPEPPMRVAIVMSRLPRLIDPQAPWLAALRACLQRIQRRGQRLLIAEGTAGADFIHRGAARLGIEMQRVFYPSESNADPHANSSVESVTRDQQLALMADELLVLGLRPKGNWHWLLTERLRSGRRGVILVDHGALQPPLVRQELLDLGAESWVPSEIPWICQTSDALQYNSESSSDSCTLIPLPSQFEWTCLTHTTRACAGPWPDQDSDDYIDSILDSRTDGLHSALATLIRIVQQRRLLASNRTIRGGFPVVSLTAVPLPELTQLRCFRTHRYRWDFEPYGLCLQRPALVRLGARPVIYGTEQTWEELSATDRPFFQLCGKSPETAKSEDLDPSIDWSREQEWRYTGNLELSQFDRKDIAIFVPTYADARQVTPYSPWPVTLWPAEIPHKSR